MDPIAQDKTPKRFWLLPPVAAFMVFLPALRAQFTNWDDPAYITANPLIRSLSPSALWAMLTTAHRGLYKPLVMFSFALEYAAAGLNPFLYHLDNLLLHAANAALAFLVLRRFTKEKTALLAALIFAIHPLRAESVVWLPERKDLLCGFFLFSSLLLYCRHRDGKKGMLWTSAAAYALSLLANAKAVLFPVVIALLCIADKKPARKVLAETALFALPGVALALLNIALLSGGNGAPSVGGIFANTPLAAQGFNIYALKTVFPYPLSALYPYPQGALPFIYYFAPLISLGILYALWRAAKLSAAACGGAIFYLLMLLPLLDWFPIQPGVAMEHLTYLAGPGAGLVIAEMFFMLHDSVRETARKTLTALMACALIALAGAAFARSLVWHDSVSLWSDRLTHYPDSYLAFSNRGQAYLADGDTQRALDDINHALALRPNFRMALLLKANILYSKHDVDGAQKALETALAIKGLALPGQDVWGTEAQLQALDGRIYMERGDIPAAMAHFDAALEADPAQLVALTGKAQIYLAENRADAALASVGHALELSPRSAGIENLLGSLYAQRGDWQNAKSAFAKTLALDPSFTEAYKNMAVVCAQTGDSAAAARYAAIYEHKKAGQ
jgi:tetratricopeptide (TPR) repeat protein